MVISRIGLFFESNLFKTERLTIFIFDLAI